MKNIKWLLTIAERKPLIFSLALLMIAVSSLALVVVNRDKRIDDCEEEKENLQKTYDIRVDSISTYYRHRERQLTEDMKATLNLLIDEYKKQIEEQKEINEKVNSTIDNNQKVINSNKVKIKTAKR